MTTSYKKPQRSEHMPLLGLTALLPAQLRLLVDELAKKRQQSVATFVTIALADACGRPELAKLRRSVGRPKNPVQGKVAG